MALADPLVAITILFVVLFSVFFVAIYGILNLVELRKRRTLMRMQTVPISSPGVDLSVETLSSQTRSEKFCLKCGTMIPRIADYCPECGSQQIPA